MKRDDVPPTWLLGMSMRQPSGVPHPEVPGALAPEYRTQVIYQHLNMGRVLWATRETNEALVIVECIETGRVPIIEIRSYSPSSWGQFDAYDDELNDNEKRRRDGAKDAELQSTTISNASRGDHLHSPASGSYIPPQHYIPLSPPGTEWGVVGATGNHYIIGVVEAVRGLDNYLLCSCPSWKYQRGKGRDCKHIIELVKARDR